MEVNVTLSLVEIKQKGGWCGAFLKFLEMFFVCGE